MATKTRVLIVDDSALIRQLLSELLGRDPRIEVVGTANDPYAAREKIKSLHPHVLTLDVEMPRMDGLTFLRNLMRLHPMPVVMVSTLTQQGAEVTLDAMEAGAVDFVSKPKVDVAATLEDYAEEIVAKVLAARTARLRGTRRAGAQRSGGPLVARVGRAALPGAEDGIIAIGASTGGTEAIKDVLMALPPDMPGVVIAQHIPSGFSEAFANRMHRLCSLEVREARDGDAVLRGHVLIAPGGKHLSVRRDGSRYRCRVDETAPVNRHRPSVDVLFESVAAEAGAQAVGVLLTGMGADGAEGLAQMHRQGAHTIAQDEASSVVWGMPGEAVRLGACSEVLGLNAIPGTLIKLSQRGFAAPKATAAHGRRLPLHEESTP